MNPAVFLESVALSLGALQENVVFVGGMVRSLLVTDSAVPAVRPTFDVDVILEVHSRADWAEFEPRLRDAGFKPDLRDDAPLCRYVLVRAGEADVTVDFMPLDESIFGFSNRWYPSAYGCAQQYQVGTTKIRVIDAVHFVATKLEAFAGRGGGDHFHHDLEDVVVIVDGRAELLDELKCAPTAVRQFVVQEIRRLYEEPEFHVCLPGHLPPDAGSQARLPSLLAKLLSLASLTDSEVTA